MGRTQCGRPAPRLPLPSTRTLASKSGLALWPQALRLSWAVAGGGPGTTAPCGHCLSLAGPLPSPSAGCPPRPRGPWKHDLPGCPLLPVPPGILVVQVTSHPQGQEEHLHSAPRSDPSEAAPVGGSGCRSQPDRCSTGGLSLPAVPLAGRPGPRRKCLHALSWALQSGLRRVTDSAGDLPASCVSDSHQELLEWPRLLGLCPPR